VTPRLRGERLDGYSFIIAESCSPFKLKLANEGQSLKRAIADLVDRFNHDSNSQLRAVQTLLEHPNPAQLI
jgi:hypothetical protein